MDFLIIAAVVAVGVAFWYVGARRARSRKRELDKSGIDIDLLAKLAEGFSGAEIEQLVVSAIYAATTENAVIETGDLVREVGKTKPLSVLMAEKINALREWAAKRTVSVD